MGAAPRGPGMGSPRGLDPSYLLLRPISQPARGRSLHSLEPVAGGSDRGDQKTSCLMRRARRGAARPRLAVYDCPCLPRPAMTGCSPADRATDRCAHALTVPVSRLCRGQAHRAGSATELICSPGVDLVGDGLPSLPPTLFYRRQARHRRRPHRRRVLIPLKPFSLVRASAWTAPARRGDPFGLGSAPPFPRPPPPPS